MRPHLDRPTSCSSEQRKTLTRAAARSLVNSRSCSSSISTPATPGRSGSERRNTRALEVEDVDPVGAGVRDVHPPPHAIGVGVVEAVAAAR